jgi:hypothetical protein
MLLFGVRVRIGVAVRICIFVRIAIAARGSRRNWRISGATHLRTTIILTMTTAWTNGGVFPTPEKEQVKYDREKDTRDPIHFISLIFHFFPPWFFD